MGVSTPMVTARTPYSSFNSVMSQVIKPVSLSPPGELCKAPGAVLRGCGAARFAGQSRAGAAPAMPAKRAS